MSGSPMQEAAGLNFDGVDDGIEIVNDEIDDIPKGKWVGVISAQGMGDDVTVIHDIDVGKDHVYDRFCSVECPLCGSRKVVVIVEKELEKIRCKECGNTMLKHLKRDE